MRERSMVPEPQFESYYGRQILKTPTWKSPDVPLYLFFGGMAGASALLAEGAALSGDPQLERVARTVAASGAGVGTVFLIHDLGRPERFLHMLRVLKVTSPLSVGSYVLAPFSALSSAAAAAQLTGRLPRIGRLAGVGAAVFGPLLTTYTAALFSNTAVPAWHEAYRELPFVFAGSGSAAAGGAAMLLTAPAQSAPARRMALAGAALELSAVELLKRRLGMLAEPYERGRPGRLMRTASRLTALAAVTSLFAGRSRAVSMACGATYLTASTLTRFGVFEAGLASARDPKYTVVPQRERIARREAAGRAADEGEGSPAPHTVTAPGS